MTLGQKNSTVTINDIADWLPYHHNGQKYTRTNKPPIEDREFIVWDGEGCDFDDHDKATTPHHYVLFGARVNGRDRFVSGKDLSFEECADLLLAVARDNPYAFHVAYAFNYDVNMIVRHLPIYKLKKLHEEGHCYVGNYHIAWRPSKQFTITRYGDKHSTNKKDYESVTVYDVFTFFATSMLKAAGSILGSDSIPAIVIEGKKRRGTFKYGELFSVVFPYWSAENQVMIDMMTKFRDLLLEADMPLTKWYGPGALASMNLRKYNVKKYMGESPKGIISASQYAYAGGRFELFKVGRYVGDIWSVDINSAYPAAIAKLPCLAHGFWNYVIGTPDKIWKFGVYHVRLSYGGMFEKTPSPIFMRDIHHNIFYPWQVEGWVWSPEAYNLLKFYPDQVDWIEGYEWVQECKHRPFYWVPEMYERRKEWKASGNGAQLALKLTLNSLYGKMAQRVGWNQEKLLPPSFHQLEWAGWVTSFARSKLYRAMLKIGYAHLISVETDGIFSTIKPPGINSSEELGEWKVEHFTEIVYLQSGFYWVRNDDGTYSTKVRGFDPGSIDYEHVREWLRSVDTTEQAWPTISGTTSRFVGLGAALMSRVPRIRHCRWETGKERILKPGHEGKRFHFRNLCGACQRGLSPDDSLHDLVIGLPTTNQSIAHSLPWRGEDNPYWRNDERRRDHVVLQA
jgi:hypothetical protein